MDFLLTDTSNNPWQFRSSDSSPEQEQVLHRCGHGIELTLEQVAPLLEGSEIPVLVAQRIYHRSDLRKLTIQYPCNLRVPLRGSMGIRVCNRIDAIAACQTLFSRKVNGAFPDYLLVEVDYTLERQLSLAMMFDELSDGITIFGSRVQELEESSLLDDIAGIERICLSGNFEAEAGLGLARKLGLGEAEEKGIVCLLEKLYLMMTWTGLKSCCFNSLALGAEGEVMALSGQFVFGIDSPLKRQAQAAMQTGTVIHHAILSHGQLAGDARIERSLHKGAAPPSETVKTQTEAGAPSSPLFAPPRVVRLGEGNIAVISNDFRRTMNTLEQFQLRGGSVAAFVNLQANTERDNQASAPEIQYDSSLPRMAWADGALFCDTNPTDAALGNASPGNDGRQLGSELDAFSLKRQLCQALQTLDRMREIKVILINWRSARLPGRILADALVEYQGQLTQQARRSAQPSLVVRLAGEGAAGGYQRLMGEEIEAEADLDGAIARSMGLARMGGRKSLEHS